MYAVLIKALFSFRIEVIFQGLVEDCKAIKICVLMVNYFFRYSRVMMQFGKISLKLATLGAEFRINLTTFPGPRQGYSCLELLLSSSHSFSRPLI